MTIKRFANKTCVCISMPERKMKILNCWLFLMLVWILPVSSQQQFANLYFEHLNNLNGLSNNRVNSIIQDKQGYLWIGTLDGLNRFDGYSFKVFKSNPRNKIDKFIRGNRIIELYEDKNGLIWMGSNKRNGLESFNPYTGQFCFYPLCSENKECVVNAELEHIGELEDTLFIKMGDDLFKWDATIDSIVPSVRKDVFYDDPLIITYQKELAKEYGSEVEVYCHLKEKDGTVWVGTRRNGLFIQQDGELHQYSRPPMDASFEIRTLFQDRFGNIWIGTRNNGLFKHKPSSRAFKHYNYFEKGSHRVYDLTVRAITEDQSGNIWIGTYNNGIIKFNRQTGNFKQIHLGTSPTALDNKIRSLFTDFQNRVWVGSYNGVTVIDGVHISSLPVESQTLSHNKPFSSNKLHGKRIYGISGDVFDNIWMAAWDALTCYNVKTGIYRHYPASFFGVKNIRKVFIDSKNTIWVGCEYGGMIQFNAVNESFERYYPGKSEHNLVCENVFDIYEQNDKQIWIATFNGLDLFTRRNGSFQHFYRNDGLCGNMIYGILEDAHENLWFTTTNGISKYDVAQNKFTNYDVKDGLITNEYAEGGFYKSKISQEFIVGGINGFQIFHPDSIKKNELAPNAVVNSVRIMNKIIESGDQYQINNPYEKNHSLQAALTLSPQDKIVTFEFSALHFSTPEKNIYRYKLNGFDKEWMYTNALKRSATYTNLWPGEYIFEVQGANSDHVWSEQSYCLKLKVLPPYWLSWWAFVGYVLVVILLLLIYGHYTLKKAALKNALVLEKIKVEKAEQLNLAKMNFFTNISHEFRTPLSLIMAPLEKIMDAPLNTPIKDFYQQFKIIGNNARKLLDLSNQVLELRKLESGKQQLRLTQLDVISFVKKVVNQFQNEAIQKNIQLISDFEDDEINVVLDVQMFERMLYNLLSNAFKFTHKSLGYVMVKISKGGYYPESEYSFTIGEQVSEPHFEVSVEDNGIGIDPELIHKIFKRFYRVDNPRTAGIYGSGVGLSLLKELVLLHKGQILVRSHDRKGSLFTLRFPIQQEGQIIDVLPENGENKNSSVPLVLNHEPVDVEDNEISGGKKILLLDDNKELLAYIKGIFESHYDVFTDSDGKTGVELVFAKKPDIVISDIAMPGMTGIELCKRLKNDLRTCHIPIILLTARSSDEFKLESYKALVDEYIEKPFNVRMLVESVKRLIKSREKLRESFVDGKLIDPEEPIPVMDPIDSEFINRLNDFVDKNLSNVSLNVESLSSGLGISRSSLHNKIKTFSGQSASEYIRSRRIQYAITILNQRKYSVLEIAYQSGFNSPSYFIKCFKNKYGITPKEFMEQQMTV